MRNTQNSLLWAAAGLGGILTARFFGQQQRAFDFKDQVALVTGGSRGLGLELARGLVAEGAKVAICARNPADLRKAYQILRKWAKQVGNPHKVMTVTCDVGNLQQVQTMVRKTERKLGPVSILINNAGTIQVGPVETMQWAEHQEAMNTHYWGPLYTMETVLPGMRQRRFGRIVNVSSVGGKVSLPHLIPYSASKHALTGLSEGYRAELVKDNIYVTTVCPGLMRTGSPRNAVFKGRHRQEFAWFALSSAFPLLSMNAYRAARKIIQACRYGKSTVVISAPAKLLTGLHGLVPGLMTDMLGVAHRGLPAAGGIGQDKKKGHRSQSWLAPSWLTVADQRAARRNNQ